jgi:hypothetical protein
VDYKLDGGDMVKVFPNRVQLILVTTPMESKVSELYLEWRIPETPLPPPLYETPPWDWIISGIIGGLIGVFLTVFAQYIGAGLKEYLRKRKESSE